MKLKDFQEEAVEKLVRKLRAQINAAETGASINPNVIFKSPVGSGKTIMAAEVLRRLPGELSLADANLVFLWLAPVKLHRQSYDKLSKVLQDSEYALINVDDGLSDSLHPNTIIFANWEKLNSTAKKDVPEKGLAAGDWTNVLVRQGEQANLQDLLKGAREAGSKIVLIVDESHQNFYTDKSKRFIDEIVQPTVILQLSATPKSAPDVEVPYEAVIDSGLIKKSIIINNNLATTADTSKTVIQNLINLALTKRSELKELYAEMGANINPLLLIQLPNEGESLSDLDLRDRELIEQILAEKGFTYGDKNLAIWLSNEHQNLEDITAPNSKVDVLIFKQAIALGWDCPRAQVLLMLRDIKSSAFKIQTVGRVLRMPEAKHYPNDDLNTSYIYTDLDSIKLDADEKDPMRNLIKYKNSKIRPGVEKIVLPDSVFLSRVDYGDLRAAFKPILTNILEQTFDITDKDDTESTYKKLDAKMELYDEELRQPVISDEIIRRLDEVEQKEFSKDNLLRLNMDDGSVQSIFNRILRDFIHPFKNFARSRSVVYPTLRDFFMRAGIGDMDFQRAIVCSASNQDIFQQAFASAVSAYDSMHQQEMKERRDREGRTFDFSIPDTDEFSDNSLEVPMKKNVYDKFYRKTNAPISTEVPFEEMLDSHSNVEWWYKNGEKMEKYFAIPYFELDSEAKSHRAAFYPDYIVRFKDGTLGIFDTKSGFTASDEHAIQKANALQRYLRDHQELKLWGGLVVPTGEGDWKIQTDAVDRAMITGEKSVPEPDYSQDKWKMLEF